MIPNTLGARVPTSCARSDLQEILFHLAWGIQRRRAPKEHWKSSNRPLPLCLIFRSTAHPRGLPHLQGRDLHRVVQDNNASDFQLAVQHVMHEKGRGAIRENPARSLHWEDPNEKWVCENGDWHDYHYDSCCFNAVRRKAQKLRHNMIELCVLPSLQCAHWHDPAEWRPYTDQAGVRVYPSREEAEYSAALVLTIAAAVSHWAVNQGFAVQKVTRLPAIECAGDRRAWLGWDPRTFREYAMGPTALQLGLISTWRPGVCFTTNTSSHCRCH